MHKIITISREFGSGGRELGKRLAEELGIPLLRPPDHRDDRQGERL